MDTSREVAENMLTCNVLKSLTSCLKAQSYSMKQKMVDAGIFPSIIQISINQEIGDTKYEAIYAISSVITRGSHEQIRHLVEHGSIAAICQGLLCEGYTRRASCFQGLRGILRVGEAHKVDGVNIYTQMITENGGLAKIKSQRDDRDVGEIARRLLSSYWPGEV